MSVRSVTLCFFIYVAFAVTAVGSVRAIWAVNDGENIERDDVNNANNATTMVGADGSIRPRRIIDDPDDAANVDGIVDPNAGGYPFTASQSPIGAQAVR